MDRTTMVLALDIPEPLSLRVERATRRHPDRELRSIALEALEQWIERDERASGDQPDGTAADG